jgi:hypothetical protein
MDAVTGFAELTLQARDPEGNVVEAWTCSSATAATHPGQYTVTTRPARATST